jgi:hypothetical protein
MFARYGKDKENRFLTCDTKSFFENGPLFNRQSDGGETEEAARPGERSFA